jgi:hypothetical protein
MTNLVSIEGLYPKDELEDIRRLSKRLGINMTDAIRLAVSRMNFIQDRLDMGDTLFVETYCGFHRRLQF